MAKTSLFSIISRSKGRGTSVSLRFTKLPTAKDGRVQKRFAEAGAGFAPAAFVFLESQ